MEVGEIRIKQLKCKYNYNLLECYIFFLPGLGVTFETQAAPCEIRKKSK
jgi:hypothetical protein